MKVFLTLRGVMGSPIAHSTILDQREVMHTARGRGKIRYPRSPEQGLMNPRTEFPFVRCKDLSVLRLPNAFEHVNNLNTVFLQERYSIPL